MCLLRTFGQWFVFEASRCLRFVLMITTGWWCINCLRYSSAAVAPLDSWVSSLHGNIFVKIWLETHTPFIGCWSTVSIREMKPRSINSATITAYHHIYYYFYFHHTVTDRGKKPEPSFSFSNASNKASWFLRFKSWGDDINRFINHT